MLNLANIFTLAAIIRYLEELPVIKTPVMDLIFTDRPQLGLPVVGADLVQNVVNTMPVVRRGAPSIPVTKKAGAIPFYEPLPIRPNDMVTGKDLNDLKLLGKSGLDAWARQKTDLLRKTVRKTTEAICAISLTGKLEWPVQLETGGFETWEIDFGSILSVTPGTLWDASGAKIKDVFATLQDMEETIEEKGFGGTIEIWAGKSAYLQLFAIAEAVTSTAKIRVEISEQGINIGGYLVKRRAEKYKNPETGTLTEIVGAKDVVMIATDAGHTLPYCALDDLDANLQPLPFFVKPLPLKDPSGYKLVGESKPLPIPNVDGVCKATVLS
jgi:hypothetical protein